jgi:hypothetical protein
MEVWRQNFTKIRPCTNAHSLQNICSSQGNIVEELLAGYKSWQRVVKEDLDGFDVIGTFCRWPI